MQRFWSRGKRKDLVEPVATPVGSVSSDESPPVEARPCTGKRQLWGQDFSLVSNGLAEDQVAAYVETLTAGYRARLQELEDTASWDTFSRRVLAEAEQEAVRIKERARQEAEVEAARIVSDAKRQSRETVDSASSRAEEMTEKSVQDILTTAQKKAQLTENRARQLSQLMLIRAREEAQSNVSEAVHGSCHRLLSVMEDVLSAARSVESDWKAKTLELWGGASLVLEGDEPVGLLQTPQARELSPEAPSVRREAEPEPTPTAAQAVEPDTTPDKDGEEESSIPESAHDAHAAQAGETPEDKPSPRRSSARKRSSETAPPI